MECEEKTQLNPEQPADDANDNDPGRLVNQYLQDNKHEKAYECLLRLIDKPDATVVTCNLAGLVAMTLKNQESARKHFNQAISIDPQDYDSGYNLAVLDMLEKDFDGALKVLSDLDEKHPGIARLQNDLAVAWLNKNDGQKALEYFERALEFDPNYHFARENAVTLCIDIGQPDRARLLLKKNADHSQASVASKQDIQRWQLRLDNPQDSSAQAVSASVPDERAGSDHMSAVANKKIAFFASHQTFIQDIMRDLAVTNEVRLFDGTSTEQLSALLDWADLAWFEWCDNLIIAATQLPRKCKIICRLHSYEAFTDMPTKVDWSKVDRLIFVNPSVQKIFEQQVSIKIAKNVIYNGVDTARFSIPENKQTGKKIASVGYINYKKNPSLLLYCFKKIHEYDPGYSFHIAGDHQDPRIRLYFDHFLKENPLPIHFDGWVKEMPNWYADKDFVISTSLFESFHYSIAEGMASGLLPLIHNWYGAKNLYPGRYMYNDPDQCLELLKQLESTDRKKLQTENREFILSRYNQEDKSKEISDLMRQVLGVDMAADRSLSSAGQV